MAIRVTIFDDNKRLLDSLSVLIDGTPGYQIAGIYTDCSDLQTKIKKSQPDVILMDIEMPGINGIEAVKIVKKEFPRINVLMQTAFENDENVFNAICAGASGLQNRRGRQNGDGFCDRAAGEIILGSG